MAASAGKTPKSPKTPGEAPKTSRRENFAYAYGVAKESYPRIGLLLLGVFVLAAVLGTLLFMLIPPAFLVLDVVTGVLIGIVAVLIVFGRRAQSAQYRQVEGRVGAAAGALGQLKRGWKTDPAVAFTRQQDVVHRVVGRPGIVLVGEGNPQRLRQLMRTERARHQRVAADTPIHEVVVGNGDGQVPLPKLVRHVTGLKRAIEPSQMTDVLQRLKALDATRGQVPLPKGPVPTSMKGQRGNLRGR